MPVTRRELPIVTSVSDGIEAPHKLVVIDDDPASIELVCEVLKQPTLEIIGATDAPSGLASVKTHRPELVLLDLVIPDVKGLELMERILEIDTSIDVILMTAHYSTDSAVEAIQKGAYDYLTKPLAIDKLRRATLYRLIASTRSDQETTLRNNQSRDTTPRPTGKI